MSIKQLNVATVVGARPQFVKAAMVSTALRRLGISETIIHTGQHYDAALSQVFFDELGIPTPDVNLNVGSGSHAVQTGEIMIRFEEWLAGLDHDPDAVVVFGDTNSTLAAAVVAAKKEIPIAHVEAGMRSGSLTMPEEVNRVVVDHLSQWLFCPTQTAVSALRQEGLGDRVVWTGDVMLDAIARFKTAAPELNQVVPHLELNSGQYFLVTVHRARNTLDEARLRSIVEGLNRLPSRVIFPVHPRTRLVLDKLELGSNITLIEPVGYLAMIALVRGARRVVTDSGGLQKETLWLGTPCITLRKETEWIETLENRWNILVDADPDALSNAVLSQPTGLVPDFAGGERGAPSDHIAQFLQNALEHKRAS